MILTPTQKEVARNRARFKVLCCGRRWGKTTLAIEEIKGKIASGKTKIAYIATTYQQARDIVWNLLKTELKGAFFNEQRLEIQIGKCILVLRGWESIETLRGQAFDFLILDEVASMKKFWIGWQEVLRPTLTDTKGKAMFISTPKGYNHFYDLFNLELNDTDYKSFKFSSYDNPFLPKEEIDKAQQTLPTERFEQEYMASFQKTQGLVYKEFHREKHLYEELPEGDYEKIGGVDFGFKNPAAIVDVRLAKERFYVENEWYKKERTEEQIAEYVAAYEFVEVYPDPENPSAISVLEKKSVNVREVIKGKDSVKSGINKVRALFRSGKLKINKRCVNLISELEMYSYDDEIGDRNENEKPVKANDHLLDALRYVIMMKDVGLDMEAEKAERNLSRLKNLQPQTR